MSEMVGLAYFSEIPLVIWNVQRLGPSTGLPTRTSQGDVLKATHLSHGDTKHIVLFPSNLQDCFEMGQSAFDLSEKYQTPVMVLSDLNLGMNLYKAPRWKALSKAYDRGKVLSAKDLERRTTFERYLDEDGDFIPYRTLPGTKHHLAPYFSRSTSHTPSGDYSEDGENFKALLSRLKNKIESSSKDLPGPEIQDPSKSKVALVYYGSTSEIIPEVTSQLQQKVALMKIKSFPFSKEVFEFIASKEKVFVIEQNRDGQMLQLLAQSGACSKSMEVISYWDGLPPRPQKVMDVLWQKGVAKG